MSASVDLVIKLELTWCASLGLLTLATQLVFIINRSRANQSINPSLLFPFLKDLLFELNIAHWNVATYGTSE